MNQGKKGDIEVTFHPQGVKAKADHGENLLRIARRVGIEIETPCGSHGTCGGCLVRVTEGYCPPSANDQTLFDQQELADGLRLSCQMEVTGDMVVDTTPQRGVDVLQVLTRGTGRETELRPSLRKIELSVPQPSLQEQRADWERVSKALHERLGWKPPTPRLELLRELPRLLREGSSKLSLYLHGENVLDMVEGHGRGSYGVALDMGTTTVVGYLMDLQDGKELAVAYTINLQSEYGYDVMSRITYAQKTDGGLETLHEKGIASINTVIEELTAEAGIDPQEIYHITVVGNTCMHHLLLGLDPENIGLSPYIPVLTGRCTVGAGGLGIRVNSRAAVDFMPNVAGFVGSDIVGVLLTTLIDRSPEICVALDIGTNGEIAIGNRDGLLVCSAAAGPAFEGAKISHGMRASPGAISQLHAQDGALICRTIDGRQPRGICGSGLIDAAALLLNHGLMNENGRILLASEVKGYDQDFLKERLYEDEGDRGFILAHPHETSTGEAVVVTQQDIRELQLAKGAIFAGIQMLMKEFGVSDEGVARIYLAGAFGNYLNPASAMRMGLIPLMPLKKVVSIGNAAGHGARLAILSADEMKRAAEIAGKARYVELAMNAEFQEQFIEAMNFPPQL